MGSRMDLVAGPTRDILIALGVGDGGGIDDPDRFEAHLSLGGGLDPTWLDLFSEAARTVAGRPEPMDLLDARLELNGVGDDLSARTIERVDPGWTTAVARLPDGLLDALAGRWIDLIEQEFGALPREEKPWIRELAGQVVTFCRRADRAPEVLFVWTP